MSRMQKVGNLSEPFNRSDRKRMPLLGLEDAFEITRTGLVWSLDDEDWVEPAAAWPFVKLVYQDRLLDLNLIEMVALSWLGPQQRAMLRSELGPQQKPWSPELLSNEQALNVPVYALSSASGSRDDNDFEHWSRLAEAHAPTAARVENATVHTYSSKLFEHYRPPSKGGNTRALHTHLLLIGGKTYSFFALGTKQWVFSGDTVSFNYLTTAKGFHNVLRDSILTRDKNGELVERGLRGRKRVLRTAPTRLPGSRRESR